MKQLQIHGLVEDFFSNLKQFFANRKISDVLIFAFKKQINFERPFLIKLFFYLVGISC